jgi:hypothetical protein
MEGYSKPLKIEQMNLTAAETNGHVKVTFVISKLVSRQSFEKKHN